MTAPLAPGNSAETSRSSRSAPSRSISTILNRPRPRLSGLTWAAVGKDPGFTPLSLLEFLRRRGRHRTDEVERLHLAVPFDPVASKGIWLGALDDAEAFARSGPTDEAGCLYYSRELERFTVPDHGQDLLSQGLVQHFGTPGGVLPGVSDARPAG